VGATCPVCDQRIETGASRCATCGFPTVLADLGLGPFPVDGEAEAPPDDGPTHSSRATPAAPTPPTHEAELSALIGKAMVGRMELLQPLGREAPDVTSELCQAALSEASGHDSEALSILRSAQSRLERETRRSLERALARLDERRNTLERSGIVVDLGLQIPTSAGGGDLDRPEELVPRLRGAEEHLGRIESDWKGVQGLLEQIDSLRAEADSLGIGLGDVPERIASIHETLSSSGVTEEGLDAVVLEAARVLMMLHDAVPTALDDELGKHSATLGAYPEHHPGLEDAQRKHARASQHLKDGRLTDALQGVLELRRMIASLQPIPAPPPTPPTPEAPPTPNADDVMLNNLLKKARSLAARVRTLPADSERAIDAAARIREATELLRARQLTEADIALTRLMRSLSYPESPP